MILRLIFEHVVGLDTLGNHAVSTVGRLFDAVVHVRVLGRQDEKHDLGTELVRISHRGKEILHRLASVRHVLLDHRGSVVDLAAMATIDLDKISDERLDRL